MKFSVLGTTEVTHHNHHLELGGIRQRAILGYLILNANKVVATSQILNAMWNGNPPPTARKMVQNAVSGIRRILTTNTDPTTTPHLRTHPPGYQLRIDTETIDLYQFRRLVREGRHATTNNNHTHAAHTLHQALNLWRGRALADLVETGTNWSELAAIEDERLSALEDRLDAELHCGKHREITPELEILTTTEPLRERLCHQFMLALYRSGRQVDALRVYRRTREALIDNLGLEPGRHLQELQQRILEHDAKIQTPVLIG
ncbi:AfsR/SARP family transcriptional regulator [Micromonospora peucetia]|nr:AfsR/SARP family transcriptional regulator [Micromonospora peucetia]MCX4386270.1 AfsR/SARP family transcriptional regulator [Micromonospora peucetia]MCX4386306.1 AfsR/SARP family transcriptional regulator [Micromonospora peucetia]SCL50295.1 DNA-binding transcriptional activator of the SARP family [Micromonospora peucetia]SCL50525.1 DNA-binding transcriptional activator of the SARP family [Micromonospora peucetia]